MSKFDKVFEARDAADKEKPASSSKNAGSKKKTVKAAKFTAVEDHKTNAEQPSPKEQKQRGRPKAKRSDPDFIGFTTYIRKNTHLSVKIALLQEGNGRELSELVEELLSKWIKNR